MSNPVDIENLDKLFGDNCVYESKPMRGININFMNDIISKESIKLDSKDHPIETLPLIVTEQEIKSDFKNLWFEYLTEYNL